MSEKTATELNHRENVLVWVDTRLGRSNSDYLQTVEQLRNVARVMIELTNSDDCVNYLQSHSEGSVTVIVSGQLATDLVRSHRIEPLLKRPMIGIERGENSLNNLRKKRGKLQSIHITPDTSSSSGGNYWCPGPYSANLMLDQVASLLEQRSAKEVPVSEGYWKELLAAQGTLSSSMDALSRDHPELAIAYNNVGFAFKNLGQYADALSSFEKALDIWQQALPANHSDLAIGYSNVGSICGSMGDYPKAISYHEKANRNSTTNSR